MTWGKGNKQKQVNPALAWSIVAVAVTSFMLLFITLLGNVWVGQLQQQARFAVYETNNYYGIRWLNIPGAKKPIVVPPASTYNSLNGTWLLINKSHPISTSYAPEDLITPNLAKAYNNDDPSVQVRAQLQEPLLALFAAAQVDGHALTLRSAYRTRATQQAYYNQALSGGTTDYVAMPGQSEHQTGLAVDVNNLSPNCGGCDIDAATAEWLKNNAYKYGFIVRYQAGKESITGYNAEPWHLRYVGLPLATKFQESGLTLEEFTILLVKES